MKGIRRVKSWLLFCLLTAGIVALFVLPVVLTATTPPEQSLVAPSPDLNTYTPEVLDLTWAIRSLNSTTSTCRSARCTTSNSPIGRGIS